MDRRISVLPAVLAGLALAAPAAAQSQPDAGAGGNPTTRASGIPILSNLPIIGQLFRTPSSELDEVKTRVQRAREDLAKAKQLAQQGQLTQADVESAEAELRRAEGQLVFAEQQLAWQGFVRQLDQPVEVELRNATLHQAVEALRQSSGVKIEVGSRVPQDLRFNVLARQIPLSFVLEGMARQGNLMLAPPAGEDQRGIVLQSWPVLEINGKPEAFPGPLAPWSSDWKYLPTVQSGMGGFGSRGRSITNRPPANQDGNAVTTFKPTSASGPLQIGVGAGLVVVAEPGVGPKGEAGNWLTVYRLQGNDLKKVSATFHQSAGQPSFRSSAEPAERGGFASAEVMLAPTWPERLKKLEALKSRMEPAQYERLKKFIEARVAAEKGK